MAKLYNIVGRVKGEGTPKDGERQPEKGRLKCHNVMRSPAVAYQIVTLLNIHKYYVVRCRIGAALAAWRRGRMRPP